MTQKQYAQNLVLRIKYMDTSYLSKKILLHSTYIDDELMCSIQNHVTVVLLYLSTKLNRKILLRLCMSFLFSLWRKETKKKR